MTFEFYYVLSIVVVVSLVLGVDLAKPRERMCAACARADIRATNLRTAIVLPFVVIGATQVVTNALFTEQQLAENFIIILLAAFSVACTFTAGLLGAGRKFGRVFWLAV